VKRVVRSTSVPIALPVAGHRAVFGLGGSFGDHHFGGDELFAATLGAGSRHAQCSAGT
jgi:hypothetical protein